MRLALALSLAAALLVGCTETSLSTSIYANSNGVSVHPTVSGSAGSVSATVSP